MVPFGGWNMPLAYADGTIAEHLACRQDAVAFDVSHLGTVRVSGPAALDALQSTLTNDLNKVAPGRAQYTHLLDRQDASVLDDIIVWWIDDNTFDVMPNASNTSRVLEALERPGLDVVDTTETRAVIAVQGPNARRLLATVSPVAAEVGRFHVAQVDIGGVEVSVAGTGYTGEDGVELAVPADAAEAFWDRLIDVGIAPAGLGARDTLRLEAGLPLHGSELGGGITPLHAGLGWVVAWNKPTFWGKLALERLKTVGVTRRLRGLTLEGRRPARHGSIVEHDGHAVGEVTSGNFSPVLGHAIAMALIDVGIGGGALEIDVRGSKLPAAITKMPFVHRD